VKTLTLQMRRTPANASVIVVDLRGELDMNTINDFETLLRKLFAAGKYNIVLNLEKLTYISSAGFGVLMSIIKNVRKHRGDVKISNVRPDVYSVFELLELPGLFHFLKTERDAINEF